MISELIIVCGSCKAVKRLKYRFKYQQVATPLSVG